MAKTVGEVANIVRRGEVVRVGGEKIWERARTVGERERTCLGRGGGGRREEGAMTVGEGAGCNGGKGVRTVGERSRTFFKDCTMQQ